MGQRCPFLSSHVEQFIYGLMIKTEKYARYSLNWLDNKNTIKGKQGVCWCELCVKMNIVIITAIVTVCHVLECHRMQC